MSVLRATAGGFAATRGNVRHEDVTRARSRVFTDDRRGRRFYDEHGWEPTGERSRSSFAPCPELLPYERSLSGPEG